MTEWKSIEALMAEPQRKVLCGHCQKPVEGGPWATFSITWHDGEGPGLIRHTALCSACYELLWPQVRVNGPEWSAQEDHPYS